MENYEVYDENVENHAERTMSGNLPESFLELMDEFKSYLPSSHASVLDIGCGVGRDITAFAEKYESITNSIGIDLSPNMIHKASENSNKSVFIEGDARDLPFPDNSFDGIWCPATVFLLDYEEMVKSILEIYRCLQPNGIAMVGFKLSDENSDGEGYYTRERWGSELTFYYMNGESTIEILKDAGFEVLSYVEMEFSGTVFRDVFVKK